MGTVVYVALDGVYCGYIVIADSIKDEAFEAIKNLKKVGVRRTIMLTGDKKEVGEAVAARLGLDEVHAELLPADKVHCMEQILEQMKTLKNYEEVVACDNMLHALFVEKADFQRLKKVWSDLDYGSIVSCYITGFDEQKTLERQYEFHKKLVEACKTRDADIICEELRNHYMDSVRYFMDIEGLPEDSFNVEGHFFAK